MSCVIGIDIGSQSVKAVCVDYDGRRVATTRASVETIVREDGWSEQRAGDWIAALCDAIVAIPAELRAQVRAMGLAGQVDGVVPVDADLTTLHNALIWSDRRAVAQTERFVDAVGESAVRAATGLQPDPSHGAPKMMWLLEHIEAIGDRTRWMLPVTGYVLAWLTGEIAHDHANASSTMLYDLERFAPSASLCEAAGVDPAWLPSLAPATEPAGVLLAAAAERLGLPASCVVTVGTGDEHAAALAAGGVEPDVVVDIAGTAEPVGTLSRSFVLDPETLVETHGHAVPGAYFVENPGFTAGGATRWLAESILRIPQAEIFTLAGQAPPGAGGVRFIPALTGSMTPVWDAKMRAGFSGLSIASEAPHLARAVLEGCAFAVRDIVDRLGTLGIGTGAVHVVGGGSRSEVWNQIKADVLGRPVQRPEGAEDATPIGASMLALVAVGRVADLSEATDLVLPTTELFDPQPTDVRRYDGAYETYQRLFAALREAGR